MAPGIHKRVSAEWGMVQRGEERRRKHERRIPTQGRSVGAISHEEAEKKDRERKGPSCTGEPKEGQGGRQEGAGGVQGGL